MNFGTTGEQRDLVIRRAVYLNHPVIMYKLTATKEFTQELFKYLVVQTKDLETNPKFYNTIGSNCTNALADSANSVEEDLVPNDWSMVFTGYSDEFLYELGFISDEGTLEELQEKNYISDFVRENYEKGDFSKKLREFLNN